MNIYREVVNRIEIPALPSLESGYYLLRFERNGTTSNVYAVVENESGMGVPITASVTEIGAGTPDPEAGEVLLAPGSWTLFFYEQVSGTNTNPDCSTIPLGQTEVTVYGEDAEVLSQTPTTCPSGPATKVDAYVDGTQHNVIVAVTGACDADGFITVNFAVASGERPALASAEFIGGCAGPGSNAPILAYLDTATISGYKVQFYDINDGPAGEGTSGRFTVLGVTA